jgi:hypothetical protein
MVRCYVEWKSGHLNAAGDTGLQVLHLFATLQAAKKLYMYGKGQREEMEERGGSWGLIALVECL